MKHKLVWVTLAVVILAAALAAQPALAQAGLTLNLNRDFGFGNGSQVRGTFSVQAASPSPLKSVTFLIDGQVMKEVDAAPFKYQFNTGSYLEGWHDLSATAVTLDGQQLQATAKHLNFVSAQQEQKAMGGILGPILGGLGALLVIIFLAQFLIFRSRKQLRVPLGAHRTYGMAGGAICPRCHRPFPLHWYGLNIGFRTKLDTCEHCGRFGAFHPATREALEQAEANEIKDAKDAQGRVLVHELSEEEKLKQQLDSSKYEDV